MQSSERIGDDGNTKGIGIETENGGPGGTEGQKGEVGKSMVGDTENMVMGEADGLA